LNLAASGNIVSDQVQKLKMSISEIPSARLSWSVISELTRYSGNRVPVSDGPAAQVRTRSGGG
jgi:hypothetical protein